MTSVSRVLTVHGEVGIQVQVAVLDALEAALTDQGATRIWIDPATGPDLVVLAEFGDDGAPERR
jgi:hypothetical protein